VSSSDIEAIRYMTPDNPTTIDAYYITLCARLKGPNDNCWPTPSFDGYKLRSRLSCYVKR